MQSHDREAPGGNFRSSVPRARFARAPAHWCASAVTGSRCPSPAAAPQQLLGATQPGALAVRRTRVATSPYLARTVALRMAASAAGRSALIEGSRSGQTGSWREPLICRTRERAQTQHAARFAPGLGQSNPRRPQRADRALPVDRAPPGPASSTPQRPSRRQSISPASRSTLRWKLRRDCAASSWSMAPQTQRSPPGAAAR